MRQNSLPALLLFCSIALSPACNKDNSELRVGASDSPQPSATPADGVRRVQISELLALLEKKEAVIVDVRGEVEYKLGHIHGALSMPLGLIASRASELPRDKLIVAYCA